MTLEELGKQYAEELKTIEELLYKAKRNLCKSKNQAEIFDLKVKIFTYEVMCADLKRTSEHLLHYYEKDPKKHIR
ncbi:MAG: hypothetical protein IJZ16_04700 [Clostridia bacterium]|nr:hypothetical protein [Clostridia bacterium]